MIVLLDVKVFFQVLEGVPPGWCPGLARWWEGGVVGLAYRTTPRRLGKVLGSFTCTYSLYDIIVLETELTAVAEYVDELVALFVAVAVTIPAGVL